MVPKMQRFSWADLPIEILLLFLKNLYFSDVARFAAVCKSWRMAASESPHFQSLPFPWLLFLDEPAAASGDFDFELFSPAEDQLYGLNIPVSTYADCRIYGVSMGCVIMHHEIDRHILYDLSTTRFIALPEPEGALRKLVLSSRPSATNLILAAIVDAKTLAFCRPGTHDERWSAVDSGSLFRLQDIVFCKGLFYSVSGCGQIDVLRFDSVITLRHTRMRCYELIYLPCYHWTLGKRRHCFVKTAADELFVVARHRTKFGVYILDTTEDQWERVESLGDRMFILGTDGDSVSANAEKFTRFGFRPNCIYFLDDFGWQEFCFGDEKIRPFSSPPSWLNDRPQIWFQLDA